jgi:hypothetical protein
MYALSGIALNHMADWNPSYEVTREDVQWTHPVTDKNISKSAVLDFLDQYGEKDSYKKHYFPEPAKLKVFLKSGNVEIEMLSGQGVMEKLRRRPVFFEVNYLHYNPKRLWTWFSDLYCVALIFLAITGLFVLKGKKGITGRGAWLTGLGVVLPLIFLIAYL